mmetsp:Transcript_9675/g.21464  ORF Transcript_9675/g.21464 Transcript_9675/m.21464 type:complete len:115 (+) Transcript_9675:61-405(+)
MDQLQQQKKLIAIVGVGAIIACLKHKQNRLTAHLVEEAEAEIAAKEYLLRHKRHVNPVGMYIYNLMSIFGPPVIALDPVDMVTKVRADPNRNYIKTQTSLYMWEFDILAEHLSP